ncbi:protein bric-a-brac 1-like isoform X2 [Schistocerca nitens]|uniref:protein bric-a-brac 1-like isoform X2 n=1 Tax=Schistocerca nitens TaxID=7011 RepID=UPI0021179261|nr:protein bric-a-brac 1-like isoform X2 [Schistocerca nitens]
MLASQQFCVKWNSYTTNLQNVFPRLLSSEHFVDLTLACEGRMIKCHKVVLSACSTYFEKMLVNNPCQHPIIFMKDMKHWEVQALVDFMYKGEVNVSQDELNSLLEAAEALQIRGLCGSDQSTSTAAAVPRSNPPQDSGSVSTATPSDRDSPPAKRPRRSADEDDSGGTGPVLDSGLTERERSSNGAAACEKKDIKQDIKQEPDTDDNFAETEVDDERQDDHYANHEPQDDSDSKDPPPSPLDVPGPSGQSIISSHHAVNSEKSTTAAPPLWLPRVRPYRQYTNDNLWAALMDVKGGGSVYRASKEHGIPRKTLRNWMKRWNIRSAFSTTAKRSCRLQGASGTAPLNEYGQPYIRSQVTTPASIAIPAGSGISIVPAAPQVFAQPVALHRTDISGRKCSVRDSGITIVPATPSILVRRQF